MPKPGPKKPHEDDENEDDAFLKSTPADDDLLADEDADPMEDDDIPSDEWEEDDV